MTPARLHLGFSDTHAAPALPAASHDLPDVIAGRPCDPERFRDLYPHLWSAFLHAHFADEVEVAYKFSVDATTARNWWSGKTGPRGWAVGYALLSVKNAASEMVAM